MNTCFLVKSSQKFVYQSPDTLQQLQQGATLINIVYDKLRQLYESLCYRNKFIHQFQQIQENRLSQIQLIYDRTGNIIFQVSADCDVIYKDIPELILVNCQIKEVNQKDDEIIQLICKGFEDLKDVNIFVFIDNNFGGNDQTKKQSAIQKQFQVDQVIPALIRKTIYQVGCPIINCFAQPMQVLDSSCYYTMRFTKTKSEAHLDIINQNVLNIKEIIQGLNKFPTVLKEEFIDIYSKQTVKLSNSTAQVPESKILNVSNLVELIQTGKEDETLIIKMDIGDYTHGQVILIDSLPTDVIMAIQTDVEVILEVTKDMMFWLRFLLESCQVYTPKTMSTLKAFIKQQF